MDLIIGNGEIGSSLYELLSSIKQVSCLDCDNKKNVGPLPYSVDVLHVCVPFSENFVEQVVKYSETFEFKEIVIHSTVKPGTTLKVQNKVRRLWGLLTAYAYPNQTPNLFLVPAR